MSPIKVGRWWWWRPGATLCLHLSKLGVDLKRFFCSLELILRMASRGRWSIQIVISSCVQLPIGVRSVAARCDVESRANLRWDTPLNHPRTARKSTTYHSFRSSGLILKEIFHSNRRLTPGVKTRKGNVPFVYLRNFCRIIIFRVEDDWVENEDQTYGHAWTSGWVWNFWP